MVQTAAPPRMVTDTLGEEDADLRPSEPKPAEYLDLALTDDATWSDFGRRIHGNDLGWAWLITELLARGALAVAFVLIRMIKPKVHQVWAHEAYQYAYPHKEDMISTKMMAVYFVISAVLLPPPLVALRYLKHWTWRHICDDALIFLLGLSAAILITLNWVELGKRTVARYRPDFLSRCTGVTDSASLSKLVESMSGRQALPCADGADFDSTLLTDGRMSWPSGHTATSCCFYIFLSAWFYLRLFPYRRMGYWKFSLPLFIVLFPMFVGITRILDFRHHWTDVLTGGLIGIFIGSISFRFYYRLQLPPVFAPIVPPSSSRRRKRSAKTKSDDVYAVVVPVKSAETTAGSRMDPPTGPPPEV